MLIMGQSRMLTDSLAGLPLDWPSPELPAGRDEAEVLRAVCLRRLRQAVSRYLKGPIPSFRRVTSRETREQELISELSFLGSMQLFVSFLIGP